MVATLITVAETPLFLRQAERVWSPAQHDEFVDYIAGNPEAGDVIPESGGIRKVRWGREGAGKRGGVRVIYFFHHPDRPLYLLMVYAKARKEDLSADEKRTVRQLAAVLKMRSREK
jgi:RelE toxin of RelE / RelB toxin-antitoxin system